MRAHRAVYLARSKLTTLRPLFQHPREMSQNVRRKKIAVIGAGTVGLSNALKLKEKFGHNVEVTVIAAEFLQQTTSYSCGGLWEPYQIAGTSDEKINGWGGHSFDHYKEVYHSKDAVEAGVQLVDAYQAFEAHEQSALPAWKDIVFNFQELTAADLRKMGLPSKYVRGYKFGTFVVDQKYYMKYLTRRLTELGVVFEQKRLQGLDEVVARGFDCIVNCSGLGASVVVGDSSMYPIRGQVLRVKAPWLKDIWFFGTSYIIPNVDNVVLGGTAGKGDWDTTVSLEDTKRILDNIAQVFPSIYDAPIESAWAGLRPGRAPLRLESEEVSGTTVVHCYGHGGSGITLGMGCADDVVVNHVAPRLGLTPRPEGAKMAVTGTATAVRVEFRPRSRL